ncbi:MAG: alpha/beta hydrolase [Alistipes sp.]|nr:alpha/beta hydrolase [Alistipes sp.]
MDNTNTSLAPIEQISLTQEWDKTFPESDKVVHRKVVFVNRYGITLAADMYTPKDAAGRLAAIAVCGPFGAVKEQSSGLYAQHLAVQGFLTIAFDPSFTGESAGMPRRVASPDINTEDFCAAVDFLSVQDNVDPERIGILGICGWGGLAISAAANDPRIKATVASTMYDMCRVTSNGYFDTADTAEARNAMKRDLAATRTEEYRTGHYTRSGGVADPLPDDAPEFVKRYHDYYKTRRGFHPRSGNSTDGWNTTSPLPFVNFPLLERAGEIENAVMVMHGERAHSFYFGKDAFAKLRGDNKEFIVVPDADHTDLYDNLEKIPFDKIVAFYNRHLG